MVVMHYRFFPRAPEFDRIEGLCYCTYVHSANPYLFLFLHVHHTRPLGNAESHADPLDVS